MKIAICVPHYGDVKARFALCLSALTARTVGAIRCDLTIWFEDDGPLELKRTRLALKAQQADYALWIDSDQTFPPDGLLRLLKADRPIIGCNYLSRHLPARTTGFDGRGNALGAGSGVEEVGAIGLGFCLMKTEVFGKIPAPWFESKISPAGELIVGEDVHFCNAAWRSGVPVAADHDLSREIGHVAERIVFLADGGANVDTALPAARTG